jgi:hypothetical protein
MNDNELSHGCPKIDETSKMGQAVSSAADCETAQKLVAGPVERDRAGWRTPPSARPLTAGQISAAGSDVDVHGVVDTGECGQRESFSRFHNFSVKNETRPDRGWQPLGAVMRRVVGDVVARLPGDTVSLTD